ncbi:MAG: hypothetical protein J7L15_02630 [Clostridiales bacterium]|nr:hypothetical protein [Clostridiales bacterium]
MEQTVYDIKEEYRQKGKDIGVSFCKALNIMSFDTEVKEGFVDVISSAHRTSQQGVMRVVMSLIEVWAQAADLGHFDDRNKATVQFCKKIKDLADSENAYFPLI